MRLVRLSQIDPGFWRRSPRLQTLGHFPSPRNFSARRVCVSWTVQTGKDKVDDMYREGPTHELSPGVWKSLVGIWFWRRRVQSGGWPSNFTYLLGHECYSRESLSLMGACQPAEDTGEFGWQGEVKKASEESPGKSRKIQLTSSHMFWVLSCARLWANSKPWAGAARFHAGWRRKDTQHGVWIVRVNGAKKVEDKVDLFYITFFSHLEGTSSALSKASVPLTQLIWRTIPKAKME